MMCKHEFEQFTIGKSTTWGLQALRFVDLCVFCGESRYETNLKQQLAAAKAELAAEKLSNQIDAACAEQFQDAMQRAEQAEAQCVMMRCCGNCRNSGKGNPFTGVCRHCENNSEWEIKAGVDLENGALSTITRLHRMEELEKAVKELFCNYDYSAFMAKAKAALEEKP